MSSHRSYETTRVYWLDSLRGLAIIAVVIGHINIGLMQAGLTKPNPDFFRYLHTLLYLVHMPLFAFLFGLNIPAAWEKRLNWKYVKQRILLFFYLYLVWTAIQGSFEVLGSSFSNGDTAWTNVVNIMHPLAHLWYLPWMMIVYTALILLKPWRSSPRAVCTVATFSIISWISWGMDYPEFYRRGIAIAIFAVLGSIIGTKRIGALGALKLNLLFPVILVLSLTLVIVVINADHLTVPTLANSSITLQSKILGILVSCTGILVLILCGALVGKRFRLSFFELLGIYSLQIYLMHLLITPTSRIILMKVGVQEPWIIMTVSLIGGIGIPLLCATILNKQTRWLFELPGVKLYQAKSNIK